MNISPAAQQLCRILSFDPQDRTGLDSVTPGDWQPMLNLALQQNLAPLLYQHIQVLGMCDAVPAEVLISLRNQYLHNAARAMGLVRQFETILAGLNSAHIPIIPIKGIYLVQMIYNNASLRNMSDIDILLQSHDVARAVEIFHTLGYQPVRPYNLRNEFKFHRHLPAFSKSGSIPVEVHNALQQPSDPFNIDLAALWSRAGEIRLGNHTVNSLHPHDLLLYLCINLAFHDLFRLGLRGLYDLGAVIAHFQSDLDWDELYQRSLAWRANRLVYITLSLAHVLLGANVPAEFLARLTPPHFDEAVFSICTDFIFSNTNQGNTVVTPELDRLIKSPSFLEKSKIFLSRLFVSRWEMANYYKVRPDSLKIYWCYLLRLIYLARSYITTGMNLSRGDPDLLAISNQVGYQDHLQKVLRENLI